MFGRWKKGIAPADHGVEHVVTMTDEDDYEAAGVVMHDDGTDADDAEAHHEEMKHLVTPDQVARHALEEAE